MRDSISPFTEGLAAAIQDDGRNSADPPDPPSVRCTRCHTWFRVGNRNSPFLCDVCQRYVNAEEEAAYDAQLEQWRKEALKKKTPPPIPKTPRQDFSPSRHRATRSKPDNR